MLSLALQQWLLSSILRAMEKLRIFSVYSRFQERKFRSSRILCKYILFRTSFGRTGSGVFYTVLPPFDLNWFSRAEAEIAADLKNKSKRSRKMRAWEGESRILLNSKIDGRWPHDDRVRKLRIFLLRRLTCVSWH